ncbi:dynamin family protein [Bacillus sp. B-jedd]|uniref:dynamin family protein n=1 Tax=Bacillus sp. B-jedd TaxID=1476857 RepID=UPI0006626030|nr:dynamin family protein [Bacillus sp. B-jedd]
MIQAKRQQDSMKNVKGVLSALHRFFEEKGESGLAEKVKQLGRKYSSGEKVIAFCGHFSAGKSSIINTLAGEDILPSSPIPTSANLVRVKSGEEYAKVYFKKDIPWLYLPPYDYSIVKTHCLDGDEITEIEISRERTHLPEKTVILDTPGIDSVDDAHRISTESAIHLADLVFYVMDYNHVQSGVNFLFTKDLQDAGKEVYLIVNQIDKHQEAELSFTSFKESVASSFRSWGVEPAGIFYTTLKHPEHPENQYPELEAFIRTKGADSSGLEASVMAAAEKLADDFLQKEIEDQAEERGTLTQLLSEGLPAGKVPISERISLLEDTLSEKAQSEETAGKELDQEVSRILQNAYLMPFETRELAKGYLESVQPGFKVGFIFSSGKTNAEKQARKEAFLKDVSEKTKQQAEWHLRELLLNTLKERQITDSGLLSLAGGFQIPIDDALIEKPVKKGALLSGDYVLTYTDELVSEIKMAARKNINEFKKAYLNFVGKMTEEDIFKHEHELAKFNEYLEAEQKLGTLKEIIELDRHELSLILQGESLGGETTERLFSKEEEAVRVIRDALSNKNESLEVKEAQKDLLVEAVTEIEPGRIRADVPDRLRKAAQIVSGLPGFNHLAAELVERAGKLENRSYTVALFGAFSAGKSSFANALIGKKVLPVSPNPTTASICRIKPVDSQHHHGAVMVKMKDPSSLLADVNQALKSFTDEVGTLETALAKINELEKLPFTGDTAEKANLSFLNAFKMGFAHENEHLGKLLEADFDQFSEFVAKEEKSCFAEWIDLYYDCPLTRKGITLVDTPGADSINARHTGVAFNYIKNADAILFVTYYNHAFSRADREFLIQLGRVKEVFELDKMFFIINAIDLAKDETEKELVISYVREQLEQYGIRNPSLNTVSSLNGIREKEGHVNLDSGIPGFEDTFYRFISEGLAKLAISSAEEELVRVTRLLASLVRSATEDKSKAAENISVLKNTDARMKAFLYSQSPAQLKKRVCQEAEELIHYCKQRVFLRFNDFFKESFNPSVLNGQSGYLKKALGMALEDLLGSLGHDLAQEMRATSLRIEKFASASVKGYSSGLERELAEICEGLTFGETELPEAEGIEFPAALANTDRSLFSKPLSLFKNPKDFFEKNGKKAMQEQLQNVLSSEADAYLKYQAERLSLYGSGFVEKAFSVVIENKGQQAEDYVSGLLEIYGGGLDVEDLKKRLEEAKQLSK